MTKQLLAALAALTLAAPIAAQAQVIPSYAQGPSAATAEEDVHGRVVSFDGAYTMTVRDERGFIDNVELHQGTIINPTGLTLEPGMIVNILGYDAGDYLAANEIDTPYTFYGGVPYFADHVWSYWGPNVDLAFFFGNVGWWHGGYFGGPFAWNGGVRIYTNVTYRAAYYNVPRPVAVAVDHQVPRNEVPHDVIDRVPAPVAVDHQVSRNQVPRNVIDREPVATPDRQRSVQPVTRVQSTGRQASAPARESRSSGGHERR
jgi:hypothetical protein